ncbi:unnamed protein product, partial [Arabidopsis halleri]
LQKAIIEARSWQSAKLLQTKKTHSRRDKTIEAAHGEAFLCYSDASWRSSSQDCGVGWIIKNPQLSVIQKESSSRPSVSSVLVAEALALKVAIKAALALGVSRLACFSDCKELTTLLNSNGQANAIDGLLSDVRDLSSGFVSCTFHHVPRSLNEEADALAKSALDSSLVPSVSEV